MIKALSMAEIDEMVLSSKFARLGCHIAGETYVVPISYALDGERLLGQTTLGKKIEMMRQNPDVCVEIDEITDLTNWRSVILRCRYEELQGTDAALAEGLLIDKYGPIFQDQPSGPRRGREITPPRLDGHPDALVVYALHVTERSGRSEGSLFTAKG